MEPNPGGLTGLMFKRVGRLDQPEPHKTEATIGLKPFKYDTGKLFRNLKNKEEYVIDPDL